MPDAYKPDLAYIHDTGYGNFATTASPWLLSTLRGKGLTRGLVIDLGCGSGIWAKELVTAGYDVLGIDYSPAMIAIARNRVPEAEFREQSCLAADLPPCVAVTALGECFNYLFDPNNTKQALHKLFRRVYDALSPRGLFVFDVAVPGRVPGSGSRQHYREGADWAVLVDAQEDRRRRRLTRQITSFRKVGELYRRDHEVHRLRLYTRSEMTAPLRKLGFRVRVLRGYGKLRFARGHVGFLAQRP